MPAAFEVGARVIAEGEGEGTILAVCHGEPDGDTPWCDVLFDGEAYPIEFGIGEVVSVTGEPWDLLPEG